MISNTASRCLGTMVEDCRNVGGMIKAFFQMFLGGSLCHFCLLFGGFTTQLTQFSLVTEALLAGLGAAVVGSILIIIITFALAYYVRWRYGHWAEIDADRLNGDHP